MPASTEEPRLKSSRPRMALARESGCSWISLSMKCSKPPFSAAAASMPNSAISAGDGNVVQIPDVHGVRGDNRDVIVVQIDHPLGVGENGRRIRSDDGFPVTDADDDRTAAPGGDDFFRFPGREHRDAEGAFHLVERVTNRLETGRPCRTRRSGGPAPRCRFPIKMVAIALKAGTQRTVVFNDAVVDQRDLAGTVEMRVGVDFRRRAVGRPAGVGDAHGDPGKALRRPGSARTRSLSAETLPGDLEITMRSSSRTAMPAESYPRYSSRRSPLSSTVGASALPIYPTIPHIGS